MSPNASLNSLGRQLQHFFAKRVERQIWNPNALVTFATSSEVGRITRLLAPGDQKGTQNHGRG